MTEAMVADPTEVEAETERIIEAMQATIDAPGPGTDRVKDVLQRSDEGVPVPIVVSHVSDSGYKVIYDTQTGLDSLTSVNMLPAQLRKRRTDGSLVFTTRKPAIEPPRGTHKCMLHPDDPNRAEYTALGLPVCPKANLTSTFMVEQHMRHKHHTEWETLEKMRKDKQDAERFLLEKAILARAAEAPGEVKGK